MKLNELSYIKLLEQPLAHSKHSRNVLYSVYLCTQVSISHPLKRRNIVSARLPSRRGRWLGGSVCPLWMPTEGA